MYSFCKHGLMCWPSQTVNYRVLVTIERIQTTPAESIQADNQNTY